MGAQPRTHTPDAADEIGKLTNVAAQQIFSGRAFRLAGRTAAQELNLGKRFGPLFQQLQQSLIEGDPIARAQQELTVSGLEGSKELQRLAMSGLEGLESGGLPSDIQRSLTEDVRSGQAARGLTESPTSVVEEAARLAGGREAFRASRLNQASAILSGTTTPGLGLANVPSAQGFSPQAFTPSVGQLTGLLPSVFGGKIQASIANAQALTARQTNIANNAQSGVNSTIGAIL